MKERGKVAFSAKAFHAACVANLRMLRRIRPAGKFDRAGRWYPDEDEECTCCLSIRHPSRAFPYSLYSHCHTLKHVARLYDVDDKEMRRIIKLFPQAVSDVQFLDFLSANPDIVVDELTYKTFKLQVLLTCEE